MFDEENNLLSMISVRPSHLSTSTAFLTVVISTTGSG